MDKAGLEKRGEAIGEISRGGLYSTNYSVVRWPYFLPLNKEATREGT